MGVVQNNTLLVRKVCTGTKKQNPPSPVVGEGGVGVYCVFVLNVSVRGLLTSKVIFCNMLPYAAKCVASNKETNKDTGFCHAATFSSIYSVLVTF